MSTLKQLAELLPEHGLSRAMRHAPCATTLEWYGSDSEESYQSNGGHPLYGRGDISYTLNSLGYRCPEFTEYTPIRMASFGCSWVFGTGVRQEEVFHEQICRHLVQRCQQPVTNWNLGVIGVSNDFLVRLMNLAIAALDPQIVIVSFTLSSRRELFGPKGKLFNFNASASPKHPATKQDAQSALKLASPLDDALNFYRAYCSVQAMLKNRFWLYTSMDDALVRGLEPHLDLLRYAGGFLKLDRARDHRHPGPASHKHIAGEFIRRIDAALDTGSLAVP